MSLNVRVRHATAEDRGLIVGVVPRLREFGPPPLRPTDALDRAERDALERALDSPAPDSLLLVAEADPDGFAGVAHAHAATDYFTGEQHGHLAILAVAATAEGRGVGRALLLEVERWAAALSAVARRLPALTFPPHRASSCNAEATAASPARFQPPSGTGVATHKGALGWNGGPTA